MDLMETLLPAFTSNISNLVAAGLYIAGTLIGIFLVISDARDKGYQKAAAFGWAAMMLFVFPVGLALYLILVKRETHKSQVE